MTILGQWSVGDVADLINAKQYDIARLQSNWDALKPVWAAADSNAANDWSADWDSFMVRWTTAYGDAAPILKSAADSSVPSALIPANDTYLSLLHALKQVDGVITKGDYDDLWQRLNTANTQLGGSSDFNWQSPQPQTPDADIGILQLSDHIIGSPSDQNKLEKEIVHDLKVAGAIGLGVLVAYGLTLRAVNKIL